MTLEEMLKRKEKRGYSLATIAKYSGVPLGTVQKIFSGQTKNPRFATLQAIEQVLLGDEALYQGNSYRYSERGLGSTEFLRENGATYVYGTAAYAGEGEYVIPGNPRKQGEYTLEDYYALPDERRVELIDGVIYDMAAPTTVHQMLAQQFFMDIALYIRAKKGACEVFIAPLDVQLDRDDRTMVEPDVLIICDPEKIRKKNIYGAPEFILEILSPSSRTLDALIKCRKYQNAGVKEYWILDPRKKRLLTYEFFKDDDLPVSHELQGTLGLALYDGECQIDLNELREIMERFE